MKNNIKEKIKNLKCDNDLKEICLFLFEKYEKIVSTFDKVDNAITNMQDIIQKIKSVESYFSENISKIVEKLSSIEKIISEFWCPDNKSKSSKKTKKKYNESDLKKFS